MVKRDQEELMTEIDNFKRDAHDSVKIFTEEFLSKPLHELHTMNKLAVRLRNSQSLLELAAGVKKLQKINRKSIESSVPMTLVEPCSPTILFDAISSDSFTSAANSVGSLHVSGKHHILILYYYNRTITIVIILTSGTR